MNMRKLSPKFFTLFLLVVGSGLLVTGRLTDAQELGAPTLTAVCPSPLVGPTTAETFFKGTVVLTGTNLQGGLITTDGPLVVGGTSTVNSDGTMIYTSYSIGCCAPTQGQNFNFIVTTPLGMAQIQDTISLSSNAPAPSCQFGPPVYVSNYIGSQILTVDGATGATSLLFTELGPNFDDLEGLVVGPDNLIYAAAPDNNRIIRIDQSGNNFGVVYDQSTLPGATACGGFPCPPSPEGPSFSTAGKLFFNTRGTVSDAPLPNGVWDISFNALNNPGTPAQVIPPANGATDGEGTAFGQSDELLIVDRFNSTVLESTSPPATTTLISSGLARPIGIAVDTAGDIFVANNETGDIKRYSSTGSPLGTYVAFPEGNRPLYLHFDASDKLYVVTANGSEGANGKVWRVDPSGSPPSSGTATCLVDLGAAFGFTSDLNCLSSTVSTGESELFSGSAVGLAVPQTSVTTPTQQVTAGTLAIFPFGNSTTEKMKLLYPAGSFGGSITMFAKFTEISPETFFTSTGSGKICIPWADTGGNCVIAELECVPIGTCPTTGGFNPTMPGSQHNNQDIQVFATFVAAPGAQISNPDFLTAHDGMFDYLSIFTDFYPLSIDPTIKGGTNGFNSDFVTTDDQITASNSPKTAATFLGFLPPLAPRNGRMFNSGDTLAVKFMLKGLTSQFDPTEVVAHISVEIGSSAGSTSGANFKSIPNNQFVYNSGKNNYQFYLSLAGYAPGTYILLVTSNSFPVQQVTFTVH